MSTPYIVSKCELCGVFVDFKYVTTDQNTIRVALHKKSTLSPYLNQTSIGNSEGVAPMTTIGHYNLQCRHWRRSWQPSNSSVYPFIPAVIIAVTWWLLCNVTMNGRVCFALHTYHMDHILWHSNFQTYLISQKNMYARSTLNLLWPSDAIWQHRSESILVR